MDFLSFHLHPDLVESYADREPPWGFPTGGGSSLGQLTFLTKYSRRKPDGTKERWHECCERVINGMYSILKDHCKANRTPWNELKAQHSASESFRRMFEMKWLPPGRGLWMMGTEFVHRNHNSAPLQNCFTGDTRFISRDGVRTLAEMADQTVEVWTEAAWEKAEIHSFGERAVQRITFAPHNVRSNVRVVETATPDHRWVLRSGEVTTSLAVGDVVAAAAVEQDAIGGEAFIHGLIFGDGSINYTYTDGSHSHMMRLCGAKAQYAELFENVHLQPNCDGDPVVYHRSATNMKALPAATSPAYIASFISGWLATDGSKSGDSYVLSTQNAEAVAWLFDHAAVGGWLVVGHSVDSTTETNFGRRSAPLHKMTLTSPRERFWTVKAIEALDEPTETYCATVPATATFTLASGILTGNCAFLSTEKLSVNNCTYPFVRLMEMSMLGVGVGFDTRGSGKLAVRKPADGTFFMTIEDSREGWFTSLESLLLSYFRGKPLPVFDYSLIRPAGQPIKGFGGLAAGPGPLMNLHLNLQRLLEARIGNKLSSSDIVDIMNLIGKCVVSGNVRRSAEIALGFADDKAFLDLKNWEVNPERMGADGWGHLSNNSVITEVGEDITHLYDRIAVNGEPGVLYLDLVRSYGRLVDPPNDRDYRVVGTNPCSEQSLEDGECCTLVETFPTNHEDVADFKVTLKHAYLYGKAVTLLPTHWPETNEVMQRNRRIGCSVSGLAQFVESQGWTTLRTWLSEGYKEIQYRDRTYSEWLGVRESIKTTSVKPSGTVSLLAGVTPGVHWPVADTYLRRMRFSVNDPILPVLMTAGYHVEPSVSDPQFDMVASFPTLGPDVRTERAVSVWEKAALAVLAQRYWADNQVSATLTFAPEEEGQVGALLAAYEGQLKSISFLPMGPAAAEGAYPQMPYEQITVDRWMELTRLQAPVDWDLLYGGVAGDAEGERFCTTDVCEIPKR